MEHYVVYGDGAGGYVVGRIENYLDAESRRNPTPVAQFDNEDDARSDMRRRNS